MIYDRRLAWGARVSAEFREKLLAMCVRLRVPDPSWMMACMAFETGGTFDPKIQNAGTQATGMIQFMPSTAVGLGTSITALLAMTAEEQLEWVERYFRPYVGKLNSLGDCYMAVLWPKAVGQPDDYVLFSDGEGRAYAMNRGLDINHDGAVTKQECVALVEKRLELGLLAKNSTALAPAPIEEAGTPAAPTQPQGKKAMDPISLIGIFGPVLAQLIPQIGTLFGGKKDQQNAQVIGTVLNTIVQATGQTGTADMAKVGAAVQAMQTDPAMKKSVTEAVVTHPEIIGLIEVGGGIKAAREANLAVQNADKPFWFNPAFHVTIMLLPLIYWIVGSVLIGGVEISTDAPWYVQLLKLFGNEFNAETRSGTVNLVIGMVLGGIVGIWFGTSYGSMRKTEIAAQATSQAVDKG